MLNYGEGMDNPPDQQNRQNFCIFPRRRKPLFDVVLHRPSLCRFLKFNKLCNIFLTDAQPGLSSRLAADKPPCRRGEWMDRRAGILQVLALTDRLESRMSIAAAHAAAMPNWSAADQKPRAIPVCR